MKVNLREWGRQVKVNKHHEQFVGIDPGIRSFQTPCNDADRVIQTYKQQPPAIDTKVK